MKKFLASVSCLLAIACAEDINSTGADPYLVGAEKFEMEFGEKKVYGVKLRVHSPENKEEYIGYQVSFYQDDKVWIDTVYAELSPNDTLESEVIFTQAKVGKKDNVSFKTRSFSVE